MADLDRILQLRNRRHDELRRKQTAAEEANTTAHENLFHARHEMDAFAEKMRTLEVELLTELLNTRLQKTDFDIFTEKLKRAEEEARELVNRHDQAAAEFQKTERALERARRETRAVQSKINRLGQMQTVLAENSRDAELRMLDAQSDDIAEMMFAQSQR